MGSLYELRGVDLGELAPKLAPFLRAYQWDEYRIAFEKSYDRRVRLRELAEEGAVPIEKDGGFTEDFEELYFETHGYYPEEHPELVACAHTPPPV